MQDARLANLQTLFILKRDVLPKITDVDDVINFGKSTPLCNEWAVPFAAALLPSYPREQIMIPTLNPAGGKDREWIGDSDYHMSSDFHMAVGNGAYCLDRIKITHPKDQSPSIVNLCIGAQYIVLPSVLETSSATETYATFSERPLCVPSRFFSVHAVLIRISGKAADTRISVKIGSLNTKTSILCSVRRWLGFNWVESKEKFFDYTIVLHGKKIAELSFSDIGFATLSQQKNPD